MKKLYYRIIFRLISSMSVGSGENDTTDSDLLKNSKGKPYIPGTTLAGIYRSLFSKEVAEHYFGSEISIEENSNNERDMLKESNVLVYDANIQSERFKIVNRDCVALDEYKTSISGAKFDFQVLEPGISFITYIEQNILENNKEETQEWDTTIGRQILCNWLNGNIVIGSKSTRGLGKTKIESVDYAIFNLKNNDLERWLEFDMYGKECWKSIELEQLKCKGNCLLKKMIIRLSLKQKGGISIRKYTTAINEKDNEQPDYEQMAYIREENGTKNVYPLIPGTSWAGAFRHQIEKINKDCIQDTFGFCKKGKSGQNENRKSKITFSESEIIGAVEKQITRNAIDRFTNATVYGALYTERTYYGGSTVLEIMIDEDVSNNFKDALIIAILDLNMGFMAVGGLTSVGRGLFEIEKIEVNGKEVKTDLTQGMILYNQLRKVILGGSKNDME